MRRVARERKLLLAVVAVASGVTISCSDGGGIGVYNPGWDAAFEDAAKDAAYKGDAAPLDASKDVEAEASDDAVAPSDATGD